MTPLVAAVNPSVVERRLRGVEAVSDEVRAGSVLGLNVEHPRSRDKARGLNVEVDPSVAFRALT